MEQVVEREQEDQDSHCNVGRYEFLIDGVWVDESPPLNVLQGGKLGIVAFRVVVQVAFSYTVVILLLYLFWCDVVRCLAQFSFSTPGSSLTNVSSLQHNVVSQAKACSGVVQ